MLQVFALAHGGVVEYCASQSATPELEIYVSDVPSLLSFIVHLNTWNH